MSVLIINGRLPDFGQRKWIPGDLLTLGGKIIAMGEVPRKKGYTLVDAEGNLLLPAFCDLRTHVFAPPYIRTENEKCLSASAQAGGYGTLLAAPLAPHPVVIPEQVEAVASMSSKRVRVLPTAAVCDGEGKPSDLSALLEAGAYAFADDGYADTDTLLRAMTFCRETNRLMICHAADKSRKDSALDEALSTAKLLVLAANTGCRLHITGVSAADAVEQIRLAKGEGVFVTCDSCPPYFTMTKADLLFYGSQVKLSHPLRERKDRDAVLAGLSDGTVDAISTDHTPVESADKALPADRAAAGMLALQTTFAVSLCHLVVPGHIDLFRLVELLSLAPARILGMEAGFREGSACSIAVCDIDRSYPFTETLLKSRHSVRNTPYLGQILTGTVERMI